MKKQLTVFFIALWVFPTLAQVQTTTTRQNLDKHDLTWIKTPSDFGQSSLSVEQIDQRISTIIQNAIADNILTANIQIPINSKKIKYLGQKLPTETGLFGTYSTWGNDGLSHLNQKVNFYTYEEFIFSTENDEAIDQKNVYYAIRSIILLQYRYPEIYNKLFTKTQNFLTNTPPFKNISNSNKGFWIAFNNNPQYISSNNTVFLGAGYFQNSQIGMWKNVAVVNIHSQNILGQSSIGSKPIYDKQNSWENYELHMTEGLPVSIAHEMIHNYIDFAYTANDDAFRIRLYRGYSNFIFAEENAVINTIYTYFATKGGLMNNQSDYYYRTVFEPNIQTMTNGGQIKAYSKAFSDLSPTPVNFKSIFLIPIK